MQLFCQSPHGWHATGWEKEINKSKEWWLDFYPWLSNLMEMMKFAIPVIQAIPHKDIPMDILSEFQDKLEIMQEFTNKLSNEGLSKDMDHMVKVTDSQPIKLVGSALRLLYYLLENLDPAHEWGGLSPVFTPDGNLLWLCQRHQKEYLSPIYDLKI